MAKTVNFSEINEFQLNFTLSDVSEDLLLIHGMVTGFMVYCSLPLYALALTMLLVERKRFEKGDVFIFAALLANFLGSVLQSATIPIATVLKSWPFGDFACRLTAVSHMVMVDTRQLSITALSIHRFCNVLLPLWYPSRQSKMIIALSVLIIFNVSVTHVVSIVSSAAFFDISWPTCDVERINDSRKILGILVIFRIAYIGSGLIPFCLYFVMWKKAWKLKRMTSMNRHHEKQYKMIFKIYQEKKAFFRLLVMLIVGFVTTVFINFKTYGGNLTFGLTNASEIIAIHFILLYVTLCHPYLDLFVLLSSDDKVKARKSFMSKLYKVLRLEQYLQNVSINSHWV